jgi:hypothetical protein
MVGVKMEVLELEVPNAYWMSETVPGSRSAWMTSDTQWCEVTHAIDEDNRLRITLGRSRTQGKPWVQEVVREQYDGGWQIAEDLPSDSVKLLAHRGRPQTDQPRRTVSTYLTEAEFKAMTVARGATSQAEFIREAIRQAVQRGAGE